MRAATTIPRFAALLLRHPGLLGPLLLAAWRFRARGWWRKPPFLPLPPLTYLEWRLETAFGADGGVPAAVQLRRYLRWTRQSMGGTTRRR